MSLELVRVGGGRDLREFIRFPNHLYRGSPYWVPPLEVERRRFLDPRHNPFFEHGEAEFFLARRGKETVGRVSAHTDRNFDALHGGRSGFFGFFHCAEDPEAAALLLGAVEDFHRRRGAGEILGPMDFTTNHEVGTLVAGFDAPPFLMMPWNGPWYDGLITGCGFGKAKDMLAWLVRWPGGTPEFITRIASRARRSSRITVRTVDLSRFDAELALFKAVYNEAWEKNWGFVPMTDAEVEQMAREMKPLVHPELIYFAFVDGEPAGFFLAVPDYNLVLKEMGGRLLPFGWLKFLLGKRRIDRIRVMVMGVVERFRNLGVETILLEEIYRRAPASGFPSGEMSWILEDNVGMNAIARRLYGDPYRTYRVYGKRP